jgi:hypothetical protein
MQPKIASSCGVYTHMIENEERPISDLQNKHKLLLDHLNCLNELKIDIWASSNENMPVTWHGPEPGMGLRASKLSQIPYSFDNALVQPKFFRRRT